MTATPAEQLPVFDELFAPDFGADVPALARELFARDGDGLLRLPDGSVVAYGNQQLNALLPNQTFGNIPAAAISEDPDFFEMLSNHVFTMNPPMHGPHRKAFSKPLTASAIKGLVQIGEEVVAEVVAEALQRGTVNLNADVGTRVPTRFWSRVIGMTPEEERVVGEIVAGDFSLNFVLDRSDEQTQAARIANRTYMETVRTAIMRALATGDNDLISVMAADLDAVELDGRAEDVGLLMGASLADGFHTLGGALTNVCYSLITRPEQLHRVRADPALVAGAFNEGLRLDPPLISTFRYTLADAELDGTAIPRDTTVFLMWMLGNLDPSVFADPDEYVLTRDTGLAKPFGGGIHNCPGRNVSRMLGQMLLRAIAAPDVRVEPAGGEPTWITGSLLHEIDDGFPVSFSAA